VTAKVALITEQEIEQFYHDNKSQITGEQAHVREQIRAFYRTKSSRQSVKSFSACFV
jgi:hypothetical protein